MCGEKRFYKKTKGCRVGSPPRVRGKDHDPALSQHKLRITPACAGKSMWLMVIYTAPRDHPRVCGEKADCLTLSDSTWGSPPRVRGKGFLIFSAVRLAGITPACAGKRLCRMDKRGILWDHPRVCGEKAGSCPGAAGSGGSPPRVRGKVSSFCFIVPAAGITPACAGKSLRRWKCLLTVWDHPRVCGEKKGYISGYDGRTGSPPRVRGKAGSDGQQKGIGGITPACAGKRKDISAAMMGGQDHPRVCGEKRAAMDSRKESGGSPPRVRGKDWQVNCTIRRKRITPACAGKS